MIFLLHVEWPEMPPYKLLFTMFDAFPFLGYQAWSWTTLRRGNVFLLRLQTFFFIFVTFLTVSIFIWTFFCIYGYRCGQESQAVQVCGGVMNDVQCRKPWESRVRWRWRRVQTTVGWWERWEEQWWQPLAYSHTSGVRGVPTSWQENT